MRHRRAPRTRPNRGRGNPGFETLLIGIGVVILAGQNLVALVADYLPAFVTLGIVIGGAALIMSAALGRLEGRRTAGPDVDEADLAPPGQDAPKAAGISDVPTRRAPRTSRSAS